MDRNFEPIWEGCVGRTPGFGRNHVAVIHASRAAVPKLPEALPIILLPEA